MNGHSHFLSSYRSQNSKILVDKDFLHFQLERPDTGQYHTNMRVTGFEPDVFRNEMSWLLILFCCTCESFAMSINFGEVLLLNERKELGRKLFGH